MTKHPDGLFTLTFTIEQLAVIDAALQNTPYRTAAPLIREINQQILRTRSVEDKDTHPPTPSAQDS